MDQHRCNRQALIESKGICRHSRPVQVWGCPTGQKQDDDGEGGSRAACTSCPARQGLLRRDRQHPSGHSLGGGRAPKLLPLFLRHNEPSPPFLGNRASPTACWARARRRRRATSRGWCAAGGVCCKSRLGGRAIKAPLIAGDARPPAPGTPRLPCDGAHVFGLCVADSTPRADVPAHQCFDSPTHRPHAPTHAPLHSRHSWVPWRSLTW